MKQTTNTTDKSIEALNWWNGLTENSKMMAIAKDSRCNIYAAVKIWNDCQGMITDEKIEEIYNSEHPTPTTEGKDDNFTKGNWAVRDYEVIGPYGSNKTICEMTGNLPKEEKKANAKRIVQAVNGWDKLQAKNKAILKEVEHIGRNLDKLNNHTWETYKEQIQLHLLEIEALSNNIK